MPPTRPDPDMVLDDVDKSIEEVRFFKEAGGGSIVEMSTPEVQRNVKALLRIGKAVPVNIVCCAGYIFERHWKCEKNEWILSASIDELQERVYKEVTEGIEDTNVKPGVIKAGSSKDIITEAEDRCIRAIARVHLKTGVPISTHTTDGTMAFGQLRLFLEEGVDPAHLIIGHLDRCPNYGYWRRLAKEGIFLEFDTIGKTKYYPDELRADLIVKLVKEGHVDQILLSHDNGRRSYFRSWNGWPGLTYVLETFAPMLKARGLTKGDIHKILVENPKRAFSS
jgi:phosphotriesterase-related protein